MYLINGMHCGKVAQCCNQKDLYQQVCVHEVINSLVVHGISIFDKHLSQEPVRLRVTGQKDGVVLRGFLVQLE